MSIAEKLTTIAENVPKVYEAGQQSEKDRFWDELQDYGKRRSYFYTFSGTMWTEEMLNDMKYPIVFSTETFVNERLCGGMFSNLNRSNRSNSKFDLSHICSMIDFSRCMSAQNTFQNAIAKNITCDFSSCQLLNKTFECSDGGSLENIILKVSEKCTKYTHTFNYCTATKIFFTDDSVISANISFAQASALTDESVDSIINALKDLTGLSSNTLTVHANVYDRMVELGKDVLVTAKNWTLVKA